MAEYAFMETKVDLNSLQGVAPQFDLVNGFDVRRHTEFAAQVRYVTSPSSPTTWVMTLQWSIDGYSWTAFNPAQTLSNSAITVTGLDVSEYAFVRGLVSTAEGNPCEARVVFYATRNID